MQEVIEILEKKIDNNTLLDSARYVYANYPKVRENMSFANTLKFIDMFSNRIIIEKENEIIKGFGMYMKLTDDSLIGILNKKINYYQNGMLNKLMSEDGEHIHFIGVVTDGLKFILRGIKRLKDMYNPITISGIADLRNPKKIFLMVIRR